MRNYIVTNLLIFVSCAASLAIESRDACNAQHVKFLQQRTHHTTYFCDFYLSIVRTDSPFEMLNATETWNACKCIAATAPSPRKYLTVASPTGSTCSSYTKIITDEYYYPPAFCSFYMLRDRSMSTIPGISVAALNKACSCLTGATATSQTATRTTTVTSTTGIASTTTSTCSNNVLGTTIGDFVSGLVYWTVTASPTAYASVTTGTSYDSSGSAAVLQCKYSTANDAHAAICSKELSLCPGQNYSISLEYKFPSTGSTSGSLSLYNYGWDEMLATITGPSSGSTVDSTNHAAGQWGSLKQTFEAEEEIDMMCIILQCLSSKTLVGKTAQVTIDNVRVVRVD